MTSMSAISSPAVAGHHRRTSALVGVGTAAVASAFTAWGAHDLRETAMVVPVILAVAALVYGVVVPRALGSERAGGTALALSVPAALLTVPVFWSGLPLVLGAAGVLLGYAARGGARGGGKAIAGVVLGVLAVVGYLTIYIVDGIILGNN